MNHDINSTPAGLNQRVRLLKRRIGVISDNDAATAMVDSDAELLASAVDAGLSGRQPMIDALASYQRQRDELAAPSFGNTLQLAHLEPPPLEMQQLFAVLRGNQEQTDRLFGTFAGTVPIPEFFAPQNLEQIMKASPLDTIAQ